MVSDLVFYPLALVVLGWVLLLLQRLWQSAPMGRRQNSPVPKLPRPTPAQDSKPFAGLTHKPPCEACEQAAESRPQVSNAPPPRMISTRGRRRQIDASYHFCPHPTCAYQGWVGFGNLRANGHPRGKRWRQLYCLGCNGYFQETHDTPLHGKHVEPDKLVWAIAALAEGLGIRAVARVFEVDPNTVLGWLVEAAEHPRAFSRHVLHNLHVDQVQMDELFALLSAVKDGEVTEAKAIKRLLRSPHWVWVAMDPVTKLILTINIGERTLVMAQCVVHQLVQVLAPDCLPLFLTDGYKDYFRAILSHFGQWVQPERCQGKGPAPKPRWIPKPGLLYAQVVKSYRRRLIVGIKHRVVVGSLEAVGQVLAKRGWQINTSFIERLNLDLRQHVAAIGRRVNTLCKHEAGLRQQLALFHVYHNFCLSHAALRVPLVEPELTNGRGSAKQW